jgi:hypothetical protein
MPVETNLAAVPLELVHVYSKEEPWLEFNGEQGTPILCVADGAVGQANGGTIVVESAGDRFFVYEHLEGLNVHEHQTVSKGRVLGVIALDPGQRAHVRLSLNDGLSVADGGTATNPAPYVATGELLEKALIASAAEVLTVRSPDEVQPEPPATEEVPFDAEGWAEELRKRGFTVTSPTE